jgi:hypothetical protein
MFHKSYAAARLRQIHSFFTLHTLLTLLTLLQGGCIPAWVQKEEWVSPDESGTGIKIELRNLTSLKIQEILIGGSSLGDLSPGDQLAIQMGYGLWRKLLPRQVGKTREGYLVYAVDVVVHAYGYSPYGELVYFIPAGSRADRTIELRTDRLNTITFTNYQKPK